MLNSSQALTPKPAALPPAALPMPGLPGSGGSAGTGPSFAQFLNEQPSVQPGHTDPVPSEPTPESTPAPVTAKDRRPQAQPAVKQPTSPTTPKAPAESAAAQAKAGKDAVSGKDGDADAKLDDDDTDTSSLAEFTQLIGLATPAQPAEAAAAGGAHAARPGHQLQDDTGDAPATSCTIDSDVGGPQQPIERRPTDTQPTASQRNKGGIDLGAEKSPVRASPTDMLQAAATPPAAGTPTAAATPDATGAPNFAAMLAAQAAPVATRATAEAAPATAYGQVHAAVNSNAFGAELGARVSLLAVDGKQSAELQLNPADMGPVAVQIVVDGSQAQVSFHAVHAETRQALEQSLPDLAAALQGQGLTLSGGGVFQQTPRDPGNSSESGGDDSAGRSSRTGGTDPVGGAAGSTAQAPVRRTVGLLDTFA